MIFPCVELNWVIVFQIVLTANPNFLDDFYRQSYFRPWIYFYLITGFETWFNLL